MAASFRQVRFGQSVTLQRTEFNDTFDIPGPDLLDWRINNNPPHTLIEVPGALLYEQETEPPAGAWMLLINSIAQGAFEQLIAGAPNGASLVPVEAVIRVGSGGVSHTFVIDAYPAAAIPLPAADISVSVRWKRFGQHDAIEPFRIPEQAVVHGTVTRADLATRASYSYIWPARSALGTGLRSMIVPPFADAFMLRNNHTSVPGTVATTWSALAGDTTGVAFSLALLTGDMWQLMAGDAGNASAPWALPYMTRMMRAILATPEAAPWVGEYRINL